MIERDFILRQVQQLVQAIAVVLARKREDPASVREALDAGLEAALGVRLGDVLAMDRPAVEALVTEDGLTSAEKAVALADLLREAPEMEARVRARWLYEQAVRAGGPVPFDVQERIAALPEA